MPKRLKPLPILSVLAVFLTLAVPAQNAAAQSPAAPTAQVVPGEPQEASGTQGNAGERRSALEAAGLSAAEVDDLIATLESADARERLISRLKGLRAVSDGGASADQAADSADSGGLGSRIVALLSSRVELISGELVAGADFLLDAPRLFDWGRAQLADPGVREVWLRILWKILLVLAAGALAEWLVRRLLAGPRARIEGQERASLPLRVLLLVARTLLDVMPIVAFGVAAYVALPLVEPSKVTRLVAIALINASVIARAAMVVARLLFAPQVSNLRIFRFADETANYLTVWTRRFANLAVYGYFACQAALLLGLPRGGYAALSKSIGLLLALLVTIFILQNRKPVAETIRGSQTDGSVGLRMLRRRLADVWHVLAIIYVFALYAVWSLEIEGGFEFVFRATALSLVIVAVAKLLMLASHHAMDVGFGIRQETLQRFPGLAHRANRYFAILHYVINIVVIVFAVFAVLEAWGIGAFDWVGTPVGRHVTASAVTIAFVAVLSILLWEMVSSVIERYLSRGENGDFEVGARARTLLPLLRRALLIVISVIAGFIILAELGVNIGPLLAGAGVVGLAVGFGSQTLVKDVITGVFILAEDQFAVGDVVQVGGKAGIVENITIRTIRLRDLSGNVHMIPFSAVDTVENKTKDFSRYVFDIGVAYREDVDEVIEVLRALGAEMQADEYYGPLIRDPLEILGLDSFGDSAIVIRARFTTLPIKQWEVGREFNRRIKRRFDELGIEIPFPHQTVYFGENKGGGAPPAFVQLAADRAASGDRDGNEGSARNDGPAPPADAADEVADDGK